MAPGRTRRGALSTACGPTAARATAGVARAAAGVARAAAGVA